MTVHAAPNTDGSPASFKSRYDHWVNGYWKAPAKGGYFENPSPVTGREIARDLHGATGDRRCHLGCGDEVVAAQHQRQPVARVGLAGEASGQRLELLGVRVDQFEGDDPAAGAGAVCARRSGWTAGTAPSVQASSTRMSPAWAQDAAIGPPSPNNLPWEKPSPPEADGDDWS